MMTVFCEGRDYGYELAGVAMLFFRGEKVIPAKEGEEPLDNFILTETNLRPGRACLLYTSPSPRDRQKSRMPSSAWQLSLIHI